MALNEAGYTTRTESSQDGSRLLLARVPRARWPGPILRDEQKI